MIKIDIKEIAEILNGTLHLRHSNTMIEGVSIDSRKIDPKQLYIPIIGERFDGHQFIEDVIFQGVQNLIVDKKHNVPENVNVVVVDDTLQALQLLAKAYLKKLNAKIIAVTGSNGKTSIKDILKNILQTKYKVQVTHGNKNNEIGLPLTVLDFDSNIQIGVLEMGMERFNEISLLSNLVNPDIAIISNIGTAHIKALGSRENIAKAKLEILQGLKEDGVLIVHDNEPLLQNHFKNTIYIHQDESKNFHQDMDGIHFDYKGIHYFANLHGKHQLANLLMCMEVANLLGIDHCSIQNALKSLEMTKMRQDLYAYHSVFIYDDSYKSNPESLYAALATLQQFNMRKIVVLADMLDLGENEIQYHIEVGQRLKQYEIDVAYLYGPLSKYTHEHSSVESKYYTDKKQLALDLRQEKNGIILFKASRGLKMEEVIREFKGEQS